MSGAPIPAQVQAERSEEITSFDTESGLPEIVLVREMPGFAGLKRFVLVALDEQASLYEMRSLEDESARFMVAVPGAFFPDYTFEVDDITADELELTDSSDALVVVLLTLGSDLASSTANLLAPVVINASTRRAAQVIVQGDQWPVRAALV